MSTPPHSPIRFLLVDDDPSFRRLLRTHLERTGVPVAVETAGDAAAALDLLDDDEVAVDCVVSDYSMPGRTGLELLDAVRERDAYLPFVLLTGEGSEDVATDAIDAEVTTYLRKGADSVEALADRLADTVPEAVRDAQRRAALDDRVTFVDSMLGALDDVVYVLAPDGAPLYWNDALREVTGYDDHALTHVTAYDVVADDDYDAFADAFARALGGDSVTVTLSLVGPDGDPTPYECTGAPLYGDDGAVVAVAGIGRDLTEQRRHRAGLEALQRTTHRLLDAESRDDVAAAVADAAGAVLPTAYAVVYLARDGELVPANATADAPTVFRYDVAEDVPVARVYRSGDPERWDAAAVSDGRDRGALDGAFYFPLGDHGVLGFGLPAADEAGERAWTLARILAVNASAALDRIDRTAALRDRERVLATLHARGADLSEATDPDAVARTVVDAAADVLDAPRLAVFRWDDDTGALHPAAVRGDAAATPVVDADGPSRLVWEAFTDARTVRADDVADDPGRAPWNDVRSVVAHPLGDHGVFVAAAPDPDAFDARDVEFADLLVANATNALERAARETRLRETEDELRERNAELERLNRLDGVIRDITGALVRADSRDGVVRAVCETLVSDDRYALAWIGTPDGDVAAWAGEGGTYLDYLLDRPGEHPLASADERATVVSDVLRDRSFADLRRETLDRGFRSAIRVPLRYNGRDYGFLELYARVPDAFAGEERDVLAELAAHTANALDSVERAETLLSGRSLELEFALDAPDDPLFSLARRADRALDVVSVAPHDDAWLVYATVEGDGGAVVSTAERSVSVADVNVVRSSADATLLALVVPESPVVEAFADRSTVRHVRAAPEAGTVSVAVTPTTDVRALADAVRGALPSAELTRRVATPADADGPAAVPAGDPAEFLTDRQLQAVRVAYAGGYFDWPRSKTGEELAADLGVSGPTFHQHLRKALDRLLAETFEGPRPDANGG